MEISGGIGQLDDAWAFDVGVAFLDAATSCGFECARRFVAPQPLVEGCCDPCQLAAVVDMAYRPSNSPCLPYTIVTVTLLLDLCAVVPGQNESPDPVKMNTAAHAQLTARWRIMEGLRRGVASGSFGGLGCATWEGGAWSADGQLGDCIRWRTVWTARI